MSFNSSLYSNNLNNINTQDKENKNEAILLNIKKELSKTIPSVLYKKIINSINNEDSNKEQQLSDSSSTSSEKINNECPHQNDIDEYFRLRKEIVEYEQKVKALELQQKIKENKVSIII